tara:strand:+ start:568 stop:783 length:216 start_codon:yes stop_codon:yes gene_type:complete
MAPTIMGTMQVSILGNIAGSFFPHCVSMAVLMVRITVMAVLFMMRITVIFKSSLVVFFVMTMMMTMITMMS